LAFLFGDGKSGCKNNPSAAFGVSSLYTREPYIEIIFTGIATPIIVGVL